MTIARDSEGNPLPYSFPTCGATKRQGGGPCTQKAGWGTDHVGEGKCKLHGGSKPIKHGRYSTVLRSSVRDLAETFESDPDPLNLLPELAQTRAIYQDYLDRCELPLDDVRKATFDAGAAAALLAEVSKTAKRIEDMRSRNGISRRDFYRIMTEMGRIVDLVVKDEDLLSKIHDLWGAIKLS